MASKPSSREASPEAKHPYFSWGVEDVKAFLEMSDLRNVSTCFANASLDGPCLNELWHFRQSSADCYLQVLKGLGLTNMSEICRFTALLRSIFEESAMAEKEAGKPGAQMSPTAAAPAPVKK